MNICGLSERMQAGGVGLAARSPRVCPTLGLGGGGCLQLGEGLGSVSGAEALAPRGRPPKEPCGDDTESVVVYTWVYNSVHTGTQVCTRVYTLYPLVGGVGLIRPIRPIRPIGLIGRMGRMGRIGGQGLFVYICLKKRICHKMNAHSGVH